MKRCVLLAALVVAFSSACGETGDPAMVALEVDAAGAGLPLALPPLPADNPEHLLRATAAVNATLSGNEFEASGEGVLINGAAAQFISSAGGLAWTIYHFSGTAGEAVGALQSQTSGIDAGEQAYLAVSDYVNNRWSILPPQTTPTVSNPLDNSPGRWVSPTGNTFVAVLAYDGDSFDLQELQLTYLDRFSIDGHVVDQSGQPLQGVLVASLFGGVNDTTDGNGNFTLAGLPNGSWPLAATKSGWTFYENPAIAVIDDDDADCVIVGHQNGSNFTAREAIEGNNDFPGQPWDLEGAELSETIAAIDDPTDYYSFDVTTAGNYYLYWQDLSDSIVFPLLTLHGTQGDDVQDSAQVIQGDFALGFSVFDAPASFVLEARCLGGGGNYTISLKPGPTHAAGGHLQANIGQMAFCTVEMENGALGDHTTYYSSLMNNTLTYLDSSRVSGPTLITPSADGYTFTPADLNITLSTQRLDLDFAGTVGSFSDTYEPNDEIAEAHEFAELPYLAEDPLSVGGNNSDDFYSFTPEAGKALSIRANLRAPSSALLSFNIALMDENTTILEQDESSDNGRFIVPDFLTDGSQYFLYVSLSDALFVSYTLEIELHEPAPLQVGVRVDGEQVDSQAMFLFHNESFAESFERSTQSEDGLTSPVYFPVGTIVNIECHRFGLEVHRQTRRITIDPGGQTVFFDAADWGLDDHEPNSEIAASVLLQPFTISATGSEASDSEDRYGIGNPGSGMLSLVFNSVPANCNADIYVSSPLHGDIVAGNFQSGQHVYFQSDNEETLEIIFDPQSSDFSYTLSVESASAHRISGVVEDDNGAPLQEIPIHVFETGEVYLTDGAGEYVTDLLAPGDYRLICYAPGYEPSYSGRAVTIVADDVKENFTELFEFSLDDYEPNNTAGTAHVIALESDYFATCGDMVSSDTTDWYKLPAIAAGTQMRITVNSEDVSSMRGEVFQGNIDLALNSLYKIDDGVWIKDFVAGANADYLIRLRGTGVYVLHVDLIPVP